MKNCLHFLFLLPWFLGVSQYNWSPSASGYNTSLSLADLAIAGNGDAFAIAGTFNMSTLHWDLYIYKSTDAGLTWPQLTMLEDMGGYSLAIKGSDLYLLSQNGIYKSTDGGLNWGAPIYSPAPVAFTDITVAENGNFYAAAKKYNEVESDYELCLFISTDDAETWSPITTSGLPPYILNTVPGITVTQSTMYMGGLSQGIYKSIDAGATWTSGNSIALTRIVIAGNGDVYAARSNYNTSVSMFEPNLYRSTDEGETWNQITMSGIQSPSGRVLAFDVEGTGMYVAVEADIYRCTDVNTSVRREAGTTTYKAYPNPTDHILHFPEEVKNIQVHNQLGALICAGKAENGNFDVHALPAGVYFIQALDAEDQLIFTEKICIR